MTDYLTITLTYDQLRLLLAMVDEAPIRGKHAALVVSIQQALSDPEPKTQDTPNGDTAHT